MLQISKRVKRLFAFLVGFMMIVGQSSYLSPSTVYGGTEDSGTTETVYMLTDKLEAGQDYIVASGNSNTVSILERDGNTITSAKADVISDEHGSYIEAPADGAVWTAKKGDGSGTLLVNGGYAVGLDENGDLALSKDSKEGLWSYNGGSQYLAASGGDSPAYMVFAKGFEASDNGDEVNLYVESEITTGQDEDVDSERGPPEEDDSAALEDENTPIENEETEPVLKAAGATIGEPTSGTVLAFTSDIHNASNNTAANRLDTWLDKVAAIHGGINAMGFCGDMGSASAGEADFWTYTKAVMKVLSDKGVKGVYTTGNHEFYNGNFASTSNEVKSNYKVGAVGDEGEHYIIYCMGTANWNGNSDNFTTDQITALTNYLNSVGSSKPIIVLVHFPLHRYSSRSTTNADKVIDALNNAANDGKKIILLWGHNHTMSDTNYDQIFSPGESITYNSSGNSKKINFYYGAAGCMSDSEYGSGSAFVKGKGLVITINNKNQLSFRYYDANANNVTEGGTLTEQDPVAVTGVTVSPKTETVEARKGKQLTATIAPADATNKGVTWTSSDTTVATVSASGKVRGVAPGEAVITAKTTDGGFEDSCTVTVTENTSNTQYYMIKIGDYVLSTERSNDQASQSSSSWGSSSYTYTGLEGVAYTSDVADDSTSWVIEEADEGNGYYIKSMDGLYLNATYTATSSGSSGWGWGGSSGGQGDLQLSETPDVWVLDSGVTLENWVDGSYLKSTNASTGNSSDKYLAEETGSNGSHLFTVRSKDNADQTTLVEAEDPIAVTSVSVSPANTTVAAKKTVQLTATVLPENATNKNVTWSTSDKTVATVDAKGKVKGVSEGTVTIIATTADGAKTASATVEVTAEVSASSTDDTVDFVLAEGLEADTDYLIANGNTGEVYIVSNEANGAKTLKGIAATVSDDVITLTEEEAAKTAFTCEIKTSTSGSVSAWLKNGEKYLYTNNSDGLRMAEDSVQTDTDNKGKVWHYKADGKNLLWFFKDTSSSDGYKDTSQTYKYYLKCDNGNFTDAHVSTTSLENTTTPAMYLFAKADEPQTPVAVTGITLDKTTLSLGEGRSATLKASIQPANATNKAVEWSTSDKDVATVNENGKVTGVAEGTATITAKTVDGEKTATCEVTVSTATEQQYIIKIGNYVLSANTTTDQLSNNNGQYIYTGLAGEAYTSDAEVSDEARWILEEVRSGYYIKSLDGKYLNATYGSSNNVTNGVLKLDNTPDVWTNEGDMLKSANASSTASSAKFLAYEEGSSGNALNLFTIRSESNADKVTIAEAGDPVAVTGVTVEPTTAFVEAGKTLQITATVAPANATNKNVTWSSSDKTRATVDENGKVRGVAEGTATITATTVDGEKTATCEVTVTASNTPRYVLTDTLVEGGEYLIINDATVGSSSNRALKNPGGTESGVSISSSNGKTTVEVNDGDYIETDETDIVWTAAANEGGFYLTNDGDYLEVYQQKLMVFSAPKQSARYWTYAGEQLKHNGGSNTYAVYYTNGSFSASSSTSNKVYLFQKVTEKVDVTGVSLDKDALKMSAGQTETLTATVEPANATNKKVTWSSSDPDVATVKNGAVNAVSEGTAVITVKTEEGEFTATCNVTVTAPATVDYVLADKLEAGKEYLIANGNTGEVYLVSTENGGSKTLKGISATVEAGKITITETAAAKAAFTCDLENSNNENSTRLKNGEQYLYADSSDGLRMFTLTSSADGKHWHYKADNKNLLWFFKDKDSSDGYTDTSSTYKYYLECKNGNFTDAHVSTTSLENTTTPAIYLFEKTEGTPQHEHAYGEPTWKWADNYSAATATFTCTDCEDTQTVTDNEPVETEVSAATCTADKVVKYEATVTFNGKAYSKATEDITIENTALDHEWGEWEVTKEATCTEKGEKTRKCAHCDAVDTQEIEMADHTVVTDEAVAATCTAGGLTEGSHCSVCGKVFVAQEETPALDHDWGEWVVNKPATCTEKGQKCRMCGRCDQIETEDLDVIDHKIVIDKAVPATCTKKGKTEGKHCADCGEVIVAQKDTAVLGHKWKHIVNKAGLLKDGVEYDQCTVCKATKNKKVLAGYATNYVKSMKVAKAKKAFTVKWAKQSKANQKKFNGYQIRYSTNANMGGAKYATAGKASKSKKISKLAKKTRYYVQVRTYTTSGGKTYYSGWSAVKAVVTK